MYKAIKDNKIIAISDTDSEFVCLVKDTVETDETHTTDDYDQYNGEYLLKSEIPAPTKEEQSEKRATAYQQEVDPITSHISRLRDMEQTEEIVAEINTLIEERDAKVEEIKERYQYPTDPIVEEPKVEEDAE
jgi:hypothetical protein